MREKRDRAYGPYPHRNKFRVIVVGADGSRTTATYKSEAIARQRIAEVNTEAVGRTVSNAIDAYIAQSTAKPRSKKTIGHRLRGITGERDRLLRKLTPGVARELFAARALETSGDTQFHELASARAFVQWCIERGWIATNPFIGLKPTKPRKRGKPQFRIDEARQLLEACLAEDTKAATAVALALLCGMRASSVTEQGWRSPPRGPGRSPRSPCEARRWSAWWRQAIRGDESQLAPVPHAAALQDRRRRDPEPAQPSRYARVPCSAGGFSRARCARAWARRHDDDPAALHRAGR
jgi:hypothetical protein